MSGLKVYRMLLHLYPARFREEYGGPLERDFLDEFREVSGTGAHFRLWLRLLRDLAWSLPSALAAELGQDARYSLRMYARRPLATMAAMAALAVAIGTTTGVFSVVNALLLRDLPFRESDRLAEPRNFMPQVQTAAQFAAWVGRSNYLEGAAKFSTSDMNLSRGDASARIRVGETSAGFFSLLGTRMEVGRGFAPGEDTPGKGDVAVLSYGLWQQFFGGDPRVLGSTIRVAGVPLHVIGVAQPGMNYPAKAVLWTPTVFDFERLPKSGVTFWRLVGRIKPGLSLAAAQQALRQEAEQLQAGRPKPPFRVQPPSLVPMRETMSGELAYAPLVLMGAALFVLMIACANVANLLLTRVSERRGEMALRAALGASRARLTQQLTTESLLLTSVAALVGMLVAQWAVQIATAVQPVPLESQAYTLLDWRVLGFSAALAIVTGLLFGVIPAWILGRLQPGPATARERATSHGSGRLRRVLIAAQVGFTLTLLACALVMTRSFADLMGVDLGFRTSNVITASVSLAGTRHEGAQAPAYFDQALQRVRTLPGVEAAGAVNFLPLDASSFMGSPFTLDSGQRVSIAVVVSATPGYLRAMGTELLAGRDFVAADASDSTPVAVVNEEFARQSGLGISILGRRIVGFNDRHFTVVGVSRSVRYGGPENEAGAQVLLPVRHKGPFDYATLVIRMNSARPDAVAMCRDAIAGIDGEIPVFDAMPFDAKLAKTVAKPRFYTTAVVFFAGFALLLAAIGIFSVSTHSVAQRTREIGVRMALGAPALRVRTRLIAESLLPVLAGLVAGVAGAIGAGRYLAHLITAAKGVPVTTCASAAALLAFTALATLWLATSRIVRLDPASILRSE